MNVPVVTLVVLPPDGKHRDPIIHQRGSNVVLSGQGVGGAQDDVGPAVAQCQHQVGGLGGDMQAGGHPPTGQRLLHPESRSNHSQHGHATPRPGHPSGTLFGQPRIGDVVVHDHSSLSRTLRCSMTSTGTGSIPSCSASSTDTMSPTKARPAMRARRDLPWVHTSPITGTLPEIRLVVRGNRRCTWGCSSRSRRRTIPTERRGSASDADQPTISLWSRSRSTDQNAGRFPFSLICVFHRCATGAVSPLEP